MSAINLVDPPEDNPKPKAFSLQGYNSPIQWKKNKSSNLSPFALSVQKKSNINSASKVIQRHGGNDKGKVRMAPCAKGHGKFSRRKLQTYLIQITENGKIEDNNDSDDKARAIVACWEKLDENFILTPIQKSLLIKEMQSGDTHDEDELAILTLLEKSDNASLRVMFGRRGGLTMEALEYDLDGEEDDRLMRFFEKRLTIKNGKITPKGLSHKISSCDDILTKNIERNSRIAKTKLVKAITQMEKSETSAVGEKLIVFVF